MDVTHTLFDRIISLDNLLLSWSEFKSGKRGKPDVQAFERNLEENLFNLHWELKNGSYRHQPYQSFLIFDPKLRQIHKAEVRDRVIHHAVFRILYALLDPTFVFDTYSCRVSKGTHRAVKRLESFTKSVGHNYRRPCYFLKCDVRKFFASVDHDTLKELIARRITDANTLKLVNKIIDSFQVNSGKGLPIGNLTSQIFANVYMDVFDKFIKHELRVRHYVRYTDDFIVVSENKKYLEDLILQMEMFLEQKLKLNLHPKKVILNKLTQGIDFLGYVVLPYHQVLRTKTKNRMFKKLGAKLKKYQFGQIDRGKLRLTVSSYLGVLQHCRSQSLKHQVKSFALFEDSVNAR
jgi:retron-type reverse transcriptase